MKSKKIVALVLSTVMFLMLSVPIFASNYSDYLRKCDYCGTKLIEVEHLSERCKICNADTYFYRCPNGGPGGLPHSRCVSCFNGHVQ